MKHVIVDFDNTMGVAGCDTDDGLALLYLLGKPEEVTVEGLCCTYGNSDVDTVVGNTRRICRELGLGMPVFKGGASALDPTSDAARFMAEAVAKRPGEISILATGSLTNLRGAAQLNPDFFSQVREIAIMGGITETLLVNGRMLDELNLSCDAQASCQVLGAACPVIDATAQACLPAVFTKDRFAREMGGRFLAHAPGGSLVRFHDRGLRHGRLRLLGHRGRRGPGRARLVRYGNVRRHAQPAHPAGRLHRARARRRPVEHDCHSAHQKTRKPSAPPVSPLGSAHSHESMGSHL